MAPIAELAGARADTSTAPTFLADRCLSEHPFDANMGRVWEARQASKVRSCRIARAQSAYADALVQLSSYPAE